MLECQLNLFQFNILLSPIATFLISVCLPPTSIPDFLSPPSKLNLFTSQNTNLYNISGGLSLASPEASLLLPVPLYLLCFTPSFVQPDEVMLEPSLYLGLRVIQAQTEGSQTSVHTWDQDSRWHVSTHCPGGTLSVKGVSACVSVR